MSKEFKIHQLFLTNNNCYKSAKKMTPKGIMRHSTGANNPFLSRYVGPDDGNLGLNKYNNHWNQPKPDGRSVCVHAWIGYTKDKKGVAIYQTLPWDYVAWGSGYGSKGSANTMGYIQYEICEDALNDKAYFDECMRLAELLDAYLCNKFSIPVTPITLIDHAEGHRLGIASNHGDIRHWLTRFGKSMDTVRKDVALKLKGDEIMAELANWQKVQGEKALDSLNRKKDNDGNPVVGSPEDWKQKLGENIPGWLFWSIIDRISK